MRRVQAFILSLLLILGILNVPYLGVKAQSSYQLSGSAHVQTYGDKKGSFDGEKLVLGTTGKGKRLEEITLNFQNNTGYKGGMQYRVHRQTYGWTGWVNAGQKAGTRGQAKRLEGIQIRLTGELAEHYSVKYRVHIQTYGWSQGWQYDGALAGTEAEAKRLECLEVMLVPKKSDKVGVVYRTHVQTFGWEKTYATNGAMSGTTGKAKRLEGIEIALVGNEYTGSIVYKTHVQTYGWQNEVSDGMMSGTSGKAKRLEAITIRLTGEIANYYDVYYRVHSQKLGWLGWAKNGEQSGTSGKAYRLEGIQIVLRRKSMGAPSATFSGIKQDNAYRFIGNEGQFSGHVPGNTTSGTTPGSNVPGDDKTNGYVNVEDYSYEIIPLMPPFNDYFYVKTDNPNPNYVRFVDKDSIYYSAEEKAKAVPCAIRPTAYRFSDVLYENYETGRVKGGYIFVRSEGSNMDGGSLVLQQADVPYKEVHYSYYTTYNSPNYKDTAVKVKCPSVKGSVQYLIDEYTSSSKTLFENLNAVESGLYKLALYPKGVRDSSKPTATPYPCLAASPYYELGLNEHYEGMYEKADPMLMLSAYPFVLDSLSFPGTISAVARKLDPSCKVTSGGVHYMITVEKSGEERMYGGAGNGTTDELYTKYISKLYTFSGNVADYAYYATADKIIAEYKKIQTNSSKDIEVAKDKIRGAEYKAKTAKGTWVKVGLEGSSSSVYSYISNAWGGNMCVEDVWVDGRYIGIWNSAMDGVKWGDEVSTGTKMKSSSKSSILIRNMTFVDAHNKTVTRDVLYQYDSSTDTWRAPNSYNGSNWYSTSMVLPDYMILTRAEVEQMLLRGEIDGNTNKPIEHGLIYDGSCEPGTAF